MGWLYFQIKSLLGIDVLIFDLIFMNFKLRMSLHTQFITYTTPNYEVKYQHFQYPEIHNNDFLLFFIMERDAFKLINWKVNELSLITSEQ